MSKFYNIQDRYEIVPHMKYYDQISCDYKPYVMFFNCTDYKSNIVNTDNIGFRLNYFKNIIKKKLNHFYNEKSVNIVIGGSLVFGFGATSDENTISSYLSKKTNSIFLNFGATAFNSKQEFLLFLNFFQKFKKIDQVIIISGANDLYLSTIDDKEEIWGNFFFKQKYHNIFTNHKYRNNLFYKIKNIYKKSNILKSKNINFDKLKQEYMENFNLWSKLSKGFNFKINFFLQPLALWTEKELSEEEVKIFDILDNSNDFAHLTLKQISMQESYVNFTNLLKETTELNEINFVDLNKKLKQSKNINNFLFVDRVHMNDLGYKEISDVVLNYI